MFICPNFVHCNAIYTINVHLFLLIRSRWSSRWIYTIPTRSVSCVRRKANTWTREDLWWRPANYTERGVTQRHTRHTRGPQLKAWAECRAARRLWLVHVGLSPGRQSVLLKSQLHEATNPKRTMRLNFETSLLHNRPFCFYYCKYSLV